MNLTVADTRLERWWAVFLLVFPAEEDAADQL